MAAKVTDWILPIVTQFCQSMHTAQWLSRIWQFNADELLISRAHQAVSHYW